MAPRRKLEVVLAALRRVHEDPGSEASLAELRASLADRRSHAVARAADLVGECFTALLSLSPGRSLPFVGGFLDAADAGPAEAAALALGGSRLPEAFPLLRSWAERTLADRRRTALLALALLRREEALDYLLSLVRDADPGLAAAAVAALGLHRGDLSLGARVREAASGREDSRLSKAVADVFG